MRELPPIYELIVPAEGTVRNAIETIDGGQQGICFATNEAGVLVGVLTDGDIRRALLKGSTLETVISTMLPKKFVSLPVHTPTEAIQQHLAETRKTHIPLVDENGKPVDYACTSRFRLIQVSEPSLQGNELAYVTDCIRTNWISSQGSYVLRFQEMFREYCQSPHALAVSNGTVAIHLALDALGIRAGDEVIVPDFTFAATINSVLYLGAKPVIVDVLPDTWTMDPAAVRKAITPKTKAMIPVHIYGQPCWMDELMAIAKDHKLLVIEDCAESLGSDYKGKPTGCFGDAATFSFYGNKTITTGEGGMVLFRDQKIFELAAELRDHGMNKKRRYWHERVGYNYRLTNLQAAIGVAQMEKIELFVEAKKRIGALYTRELSDIPHLTLPLAHKDLVNSYWLYTMAVNPGSPISRDELIEKLLFRGIETRPVFFPLHHMPPYKEFVSRPLPVSTDISERGLSLPSAVTLKDADVLEVTKAIKSIFNSRNLRNDL